MKIAQNITVYEQTTRQYIHLPKRVGEQVHETVERHYRKVNKYATACYIGRRFSAWGDEPRGDMFSVYPGSKEWEPIQIIVC